MVVHLLKVQFESVVEADGMVLEEVDVERLTEAQMEQAVDELPVGEQASFVGDAEYAMQLE